MLVADILWNASCPPSQYEFTMVWFTQQSWNNVSRVAYTFTFQSSDKHGILQCYGWLMTQEQVGVGSTLEL